jgi:hypothetical protein
LNGKTKLLLEKVVEAFDRFLQKVWLEIVKFLIAKLKLSGNFAH